MTDANGRLPSAGGAAILQSMALEDDNGRGGIKSIEVGVRLLSVLAATRRPLPLGELARSARMAPSKAHRYLASFVKVGLVQQDPGTRDYRLGPFAFEMGLAAIGNSSHLNSAIETQVKLRDELDETVVLSVWGSHGPSILRIEESSHPVIMTMKVGVTLPLMASAAGRIFAAYMPRRIIEAHLQANEASTSFGRRGPVHYADIEPELKEIRQARCATSMGEVLRGVSATAVPLISLQGQLVASLAVIGQQDSLDMSTKGRTARALLQASAAYERRGFTAPASDGSMKPIVANPKPMLHDIAAPAIETRDLRRSSRRNR
jgi:DNA-binding IclR family transcriptional regulator